MYKTNLATYLNDHLAGSVVALDLLDHLDKFHRGSSLATALADIRQQILEDRNELEGFMSRLGITKSGPRKAMAWVSEKFAEIKLSLDDKAGGPLHLFEALEAIALGIDGKRALWSALVAAGIPEISRTATERLIDRAKHQREVIEALRLQAASNALQRDL
jgi:hypothetical protein